MTTGSLTGHTDEWSGREPIHAVFFDFADTLFSSRMLRDVHLRQLRFVGDAIGVTASDAELRTSYREGLGVAYRSVASRPLLSPPRALRPGVYGDGPNSWPRIGSRTCQIRSRPPVRSDDRGRRIAFRLPRFLARPFGSVDCMSRLCRTSTKSNLKRLVRRLELESSIDACTSSESAQSCKPDPGIYEYAAREGPLHCGTGAFCR